MTTEILPFLTESSVMGNESSATCEAQQSNSAMKIAAAVIYPSIILLSTVGNSIVILTVVRSAAMRTITNLFIANLAVSDLLMTFVSTPFTPMAFYMKGWKLPTVLCHLLPMTMGTSVYVSTLTSTAIAVDRYLVIVHPFVSRMSELICGLIIASVWLFSILVTLPLGIYQEIKVDPVTKDANCEESWPDKGSQPIYTVITFVLQFVVPCFIISLCYYRVSCVLRARCDLKIGTGQKSREREESDIRRKRRTNKMLIAMVVIFVLCWIPLHALWIIVDSVGGQIEESWHFHNAFIFCHMLAMSSAVYNPFLYAWLNNNFRQELQAILQCRGKTQNPRNVNRSDIPNVEMSYLPTNTYRMNTPRVSFDVTSPRKATTHRLTIADGDGGVWHGPSVNETIEAETQLGSRKIETEYHVLCCLL
ncbi:Neuropeptide Y receptor invertebrate [Fasciola gigantica]|uniref:Neuropeptide Y receptor invertebrate n=1 Tax=Fasciola gigantica TaxID=46835 RepID=A0A504YI99_FASGI|nr:Neuropeptide Y receptor invertebrate [Fasciola gigantica]